MEGNIRRAIRSPGAINTELTKSITNEAIRGSTKAFYEQYAIPVERVALTIKQSIDLPEDASWNEVIIRPTKQVL